MRYIHNPVSVEAIQWNGENFDEVDKLVSSAGARLKHTLLTDKSIIIFRNDGNHYVVSLNSWVIKRDSGCIYSCSEESFKTNYKEN
jgi:hypothetical protein